MRRGHRADAASMPAIEIRVNWLTGRIEIVSTQIPPPIDRRDAGFTIIEVLIALAVVAVSIVAIGSVMSTNVRGVRSLEQHVTLMQTARSVMAADIPPRAELGPGAVSGQDERLSVEDRCRTARRGLGRAGRGRCLDSRARQDSGPVTFRRGVGP